MTKIQNESIKSFVLINKKYIFGSFHLINSFFLNGSIFFSTKFEIKVNLKPQMSVYFLFLNGPLKVLLILNAHCQFSDFSFTSVFCHFLMAKFNIAHLL